MASSLDSSVLKEIRQLDEKIQQRESSKCSLAESPESRLVILTKPEKKLPFNNPKKKDYVKYVKSQDLDAVYEEQRFSKINIVPQPIQEDNDYVEVAKP